MEPLPPHDPRLKTVLIRRLGDELYAHEHAQLRRQLKALIGQNSRLHGNSQQCFLFRNEIFGGEAYGKGMLPRPMNWLDKSLVPAMKDYLQERRALVDGEIPQVMGYATAVVNLSDRPADYYRLLPGTLHGVVHQWEHYFLHKEPALSEAEVQAFLVDHAPYLDLMKQRMTLNFLKQT